MSRHLGKVMHDLNLILSLKILLQYFLFTNHSIYVDNNCLLIKISWEKAKPVQIHWNIHKALSRSYTVYFCVRTRVHYFKLHLTTILCPLVDVFCLFGKIILKNHVIMMFLPSVSMLESVWDLCIRVLIRIDGRGHTDMDRCS